MSTRCTNSGLRLYKDKSGIWWRELPGPDSPWVNLGVSPRPSGLWRTFLWHVGHGLVMGYPFVEILIWSWRNRRLVPGA